jgi:hypothetical protein
MSERNCVLRVNRARAARSKRCFTKRVDRPLNNLSLRSAERRRMRFTNKDRRLHYRYSFWRSFGDEVYSKYTTIFRRSQKKHYVAVNSDDVSGASDYMR